MSTLATVIALSTLLSASAVAQTPPNDAPQSPPSGAAASASAGQFKIIDAAIKELAVESGERFTACLATIDYLRDDLAANQRRLKARNNGKIPSDQAGLISLKIKRVGRQQQYCMDQAKQFGAHFDMAMRSLTSVEPHNHPGIPARRAKIGALRMKFNAALKAMSAETRRAKNADGGAADAGDADQTPEK